MVRGLDHDLVGPDAVDADERPVPMLSDLADPFECGEFVRHTPDRPTRPVRLPAIRYARTSGGVIVSWPSQNGQLSFAVASFGFRKAPGRWERAAENTTQVDVA